LTAFIGDTLRGELVKMRRASLEKFEGQKRNCTRSPKLPQFSFLKVAQFRSFHLALLVIIPTIFVAALRSPFRVLAQPSFVSHN